MIRNIVLAVSSLAVLIALYLAYAQLVRAPGLSDQERQGEGIPQQVQQDREPLRIGEGIEIPAGGEMMLRVFDEQTGRSTAMFSFKDWKPSSGSSNEIEVTEPELAMAMPSGMIATVRAESGQIVADRVDQSQMRPRQGYMEGNVCIEIDRSTEEERTPAEERPEDVIRITTERIDFDLIRGHLQTEHRVHVAAEEFEIAGTGIDLVWNRDDNRVENLEIRQGEEFVAYLESGLFGLVAGEQDESADVPTTAPASAPTTAPTEELKKPPVRPRRKRRGTTYVCTLKGAIDARQYQQGRVVAGMQADEIRLLFDLGGDAGRSLRRTRRAESRPARSRDNGLVVRWNGPLNLIPERTPRGLEKSRMHFTATGAPAVMSRGNETVRCRKVEYHDETGRIWLDPMPGEIVTVDIGESISATAGGVYVAHNEAGQRLVKLTGPVDLRQRGKAGHVRSGSSIRAEQWAELLVGGGEGRKGAAGATLEFEGLESATFVGDVRISLKGQQLAAHQLNVEFLPETEGQALEELLHKAVAWGDVRLRDDGGGLACWQLALDFDHTADGDLYPRRMDARGKVVLTRGADYARNPLWATTRWLAGMPSARPARIAGDRVIADMAPRAVDGIAASQPVERSSDRTNFVIRTLTVDGKASLRDERARVAVRGDRISAIFAGDNELVTASVTGAAASHARVHAAPYTVTGEKIDLDRDGQTLAVNGPSHLAFATRRGLQGQRRASASRVEVDCAQSLRIDGRGNEIRFVGDVVARSADERLECDTLKLVLEDTPDTTTPETPQRRSIWSVARRAIRPDRPEPARGGGLALQTDNRARMRKELSRVLADNALVVSEQASPTGGEPLVHASIEAPELRVEMANRQILTIGRTRMLVLDRRGQRMDDRTQAAIGVPSALVSRGPSQTAMQCQGRMIYTLGEDGPGRRDTVVLEEAVQFEHRTGTHMIGTTVADTSAPGQTKDRNAHLECERLECWLGANDRIAPSEMGSLARMPTRLVSLLAAGSVYLRDEQTRHTREVFADQVEFDREQSLLHVRGIPGTDARVYSVDQSSERLDGVTAQQVLIDLKTGDIRATNVSGETVR